MSKGGSFWTTTVGGAAFGCVFAASIVAGLAAETFQFSDYPSTAALSVPPAGPDDSKAPDAWGAVDPRVKEIIREEISENGPNFAGAYFLATVGCGSGCEAIFVIDLYDGYIFKAPISATNGVMFQRDSQLIIIKENKLSGYESPRKYLTFDGALFGELNHYD